MRIAHIADIHIRGLQRHDEYRMVFRAFFEDLATRGVDVIFVGGDIFHTKTSGITPEYIDFMRWWFTGMTAVAPVYMILGNHDGNLVNATRQDAVSPIVSALGNERIHLYKQSGVYEFARGWNWCVFSLFDKESWKSVAPVDGKVNIACYHGPVKSCITETEWIVEDGISVDFFEKYSVALLGDIHRFQYLGYRNGNPWIAYPGTPVCQNFAEGNYPHGYLLWDIADDGSVNSVEHISLPQPYPFVTIDWKGDVEIFKREAAVLPDGARFRIRSDVWMSQEEIRAVSDTLKFKKSACEVVFKSEQTKKNDVFSAGGLEMVRDDLRNPEVQMILLRDFYRDHQVTPEEWDKISELVTKYLQIATAGEDASRGVKWTVNSMEFDNLFTYGKGNVINFDKLSGIVGILGPNKCGKSSIVGTLMYGLFNASDRGSIKNLYIVNERKGYGEVKLSLTVNGTQYKITRETSKSDTKRGDTIAATSLDLVRVNPDGTETSLNGEARPDTEKVIRKLIGTHDDFLLTSMSTQGDLTRFINEGSSFRKLILTKFLDLDIFERMYVHANKAANAASVALKSMPARDWDFERTKLTEKIAKCDEFLARVNAKLGSLRQELHDVSVKVALHQNVTPVSQEVIERCKIRIGHLEHYRSEHYTTVQKYEGEISAYTSELEKVKEELAQYDIKSLEVQRESGLALKQALATLEFQLAKERQTLEHINKSVKRLSMVPCGDQFPSCMFIKDSHTDREKLLTQKDTVSSLEKSVEDARKSLAVWESQDVINKIAQYNKKLALENRLSHDLSAARLKLSQAEGKLKETSAQLAAENEKLADMEDALKKNESLGLIELRATMTALQGEIEKFDRMRMETATSKGKLESELIKLGQQEAQWKKLTGELKIYEMIANAFSKKGIPTRIINSQLPAINAEIAQIMHGVVDYTVELVADEDSNAMEIYLNSGESRRIVELGSGMEKMFAALAIRVALQKITTLPKTDIFTIDEGFGVLDETNIEACNRFLTSLKKYFRLILVITHVDAVKDVTDNIIEITRNEKDSRVYFV